MSIQVKSGQSGDLVATQIVLFAPGSNRPDAEPGPDNAQLVATIKNTNASAEGPVLTVADKDGDRKITIGPETSDLDCTGSTYYRHQGRLGGHDDRSETGGWVITGASSHQCFMNCGTLTVEGGNTAFSMTLPAPTTQTFYPSPEAHWTDTPHCGTTNSM